MPELDPNSNRPQMTEADVHSRCVVSATVMIANVAVNWPLQSFRLEQSVFAHHRLVLEFSLDIEAANQGREFVSTTKYQDTIGKSVSLKITPADEYVAAGEALEFFGLITNVGFSNTGGEMNRIVIEAMSPTILTDQSRGYVFFENMSFEDIVRTIMGQYNIDTGSISVSGAATRDFWTKWGLTDWEYLTSGWKTYPGWVFYDGKKLVVEEKKSRNTHTLTWQKHIGSANLKMNVTGFKYKNYTWDEAAKSVIEKNQPAPQTQFSGIAKKAYNASGQNMGKVSSAILPTRGDSKAAQEKQVTEAMQAEQLGSLTECHLQTNVPSLKVGDAIQLEGMGDTYTGVFIITSIMHHIETGTDYHNFVTASPLESACPPWPQVKHEVRTDPITAIVTDNVDPDLRGRVKVKFPAKGENGSDLISPWLRTISGYAGNNRGIYFMPEIADEVLVAFEMGDPNMPIVLGAMWNGTDKPPQSAIDPKGSDGEASKNDLKVIYTRSGHQIAIDDKDGSGKIKIIDRTGKNTMIIDSKENTINITADKDYNLTVKGNITLKADGDFKLEAQNVSIDAKTSCKIKAGGGGAEVKSSGMMTLDAQGNLQQSAAMMDISGKGPVTVKGSPISLN